MRGKAGSNRRGGFDILLFFIRILLFNLKVKYSCLFSWFIEEISYILVGFCQISSLRSLNCQNPDRMNKPNLTILMEVTYGTLCHSRGDLLGHANGDLVR